MSRSKATSRPGDSYHHGQLRRALLDAARALASEVGVDGFTLREVARRAGVSHAAPYHHFADKAALVRTLAREAFERLTTRLRAAANSSGPPLKRLEAVGIAYVDFALENSAEFRFMFRRDLCGSDEDADFDRASFDAFQVLVDSMQKCNEAGLLRPIPFETLPLACWSIVHGLADILMNDPGRTPLTGAKSAQQTARILIQLLERGFRVP